MNVGIIIAHWTQANKISKTKRTIIQLQIKCAYCKKTGHILEECYKKKNADGRKTKSDTQNQPSTSGN